MTRQFTLPDLGEGVKEGQVLRLLVAEGERVNEDQMLMEVETDKAAVEIPSPYSGVVTRWHVAEQQTVNVGDVMVTFDDGGAVAHTVAHPDAHTDAPTDAHTDAHTDAPTDAPADAPTDARTDARARLAGPSSRKPASPAVRKLARTLGVDLESIQGSGPGGRVLRQDVEIAAAAPGDGTAASAGAGPPRTRPTTVPPTRAPMAPPIVTPIQAVEPPGVDSVDAYGPVRREAISKTRRAIALAMKHSIETIPHVTDCDDADVTELDRLRRGYNAARPPEEKLSFLPFVIRAVARALELYPIFNASFDEAAGEIVYKRYVNIAVGVQTERGLVAPVLHDCTTLGVAEIGRRMAAIAERVKSGHITLDDARGATYTISNAGAMGGSRYSTPIITLPQVAILAIGRSRSFPWVVDGEITPRLIMPLSHSMDHRIIDGAIEIAFMRQLVGDLENPGRLLL